MKRILILIIGLIGVAYGQSSPTSAKTRFVNGLYLGTKLDSYFNAADSNAIYWRADSSLMAKYKGTARRLLFVSDSATYLNQVVRTFGPQTVGGNKTFSNDASFNGVSIGEGGGNISTNTRVGSSALGSNTTGNENVAIGASALGSNNTGQANVAIGYNALQGSQNASLHIAIGNRALEFLNNNSTGSIAIGAQSLRYTTTGGGNTAVGNYSGILTTTGSNNSYFGRDAGYNLTTGSFNNIFGSSAAYRLTTGSYNIIIGDNAGGSLLPSGLATGSQNIFIGASTTPSSTSAANEIAIGHNATGNGSNTVTIGNSSVTNNYFSGNVRAGAFIRSGGTSSQFLKADGSLDGTSYATAASLSGYLPLSGGTLTGALNGTSLSMSGGGSFGSTLRIGGSLKSWDAFEPALQIKTMALGSSGQSNGRIFTNTYYDGNYRYQGTGTATMYEADGGFFWSTAASGVADGLISWAERMRLTTAGNLLINTTTTDGVNKLIVNGGVKGGNFNGTNFISSAQSNTINIGQVTNYPNYNFIGFGGYWGLRTDNSNGFNIDVFNSNSPINALNITTTGAITASSSVTANSFVKSGGTSTQFLKADGSVDGSTYVNTSSTQSVGGNKTFTSSTVFTGVRFAYSSVSSNYTLTDNDDYIVVSNASTITLPTAVGRAGKRYVIRSTAGAGVTSSLATTSSQTVDGAAGTFSFGNGNYNILIVFSDGANWFSEQWITGS